MVELFSRKAMRFLRKFSISIIIVWRMAGLEDVPSGSEKGSNKTPISKKLLQIV